MKKGRPRASGLWLLIWLLALSCSEATTMLRYDCPVCEKPYVVGEQSDCSNCRFIAFGPIKELTAADRAALRAYVASKPYLAALSLPREERLLLLYEKVPMRALYKASIFYQAASGSSPRSAPERLLLEATFTSLKTAESMPTSDADGQSILLMLADVLRRMQRFDEARSALGKLAATTPALAKNLSDSLQVVSDHIEMKSDWPLPQWGPAEGKITAKPIAAKQAAFGLPLNQTPVLATQPTTTKYPLEMRYARIAGEVVVAVAVSAAGVVTDTKSLRATQPEFVEEAVKFARGCRFQPSGAAFECTVTVLFELREE